MTDWKEFSSSLDTVAAISLALATVGTIFLVVWLAVQDLIAGVMVVTTILWILGAIVLPRMSVAAEDKARAREKKEAR